MSYLIEPICNNSELRPLRPFYVYLLVDPRDECVFYVGKGQGERALNHVAEVRQLIAKGVALESSKHRRIEEILESDSEPNALVVARFDDEKQAHAVESVLINFVYDYKGALTNSVRGHGAEFVRRFGDMSELSGIDVPERVRSQDGKFTAGKVEGLKAAGAYELLARIRLQLSKLGFALRDFAPGTQDRPFDPGESNGWLGLIVAIEGIDFLVSFSKKCQPVVRIANTPATRNTRAYDGLARIVATMGNNFRIGKPTNIKVEGEGRYRDFERLNASGEFKPMKPRFDPDNLEPLAELMLSYRKTLSPTTTIAGSVV